MSIAIVDAGGHLVLFERMMAPYGWATGNISIAKANTSVMFNQSTDAVAQWAFGIPGFAASLAAMTDGKFIMAAGGWPIRVMALRLVVIGVSGGNAPVEMMILRAQACGAIGAYHQSALQAAPVPQPVHISNTTRPTANAQQAQPSYQGGIPTVPPQNRREPWPIQWSGRLLQMQQ